MDYLFTYLKRRLHNKNLLDTHIYCSLKQNESIQYWFRFAPSYNTIDMTMHIISYNKYIRENERCIKISQFGKIENIVYELILSQLTHLSTDTALIIGIRFDEDPIPTTDLVEVIINRTPKGYNLDECPVCKLPWITTQSPVLFNCEHRICVECLMGIVRNDGNSCPVCREVFI
jgi:hypothetical protein